MPKVRFRAAKLENEAAKLREQSIKLRSCIPVRNRELPSSDPELTSSVPELNSESDERAAKYLTGGFFFQHCFICRPSDSTLSEDAGIEHRTVATSALAGRCSNH